ncbi:AraC family transcriptional regulator [Novosphingobium sp.]|uniref:helix-turn-helix transcriptional regulator n=1 Tax=Novosphingobium sp. TaxID=1874826 RepID=UPI0028AA500C|nr:AraC family transcriptional regulator [Novosphingobium sp.]
MNSDSGDRRANWKEMATISGQPIPSEGFDRVQGPFPAALRHLAVDAEGSWLIMGKQLYAASIADLRLEEDYCDDVLSDNLVSVQFIVEGAFDFLIDTGGRYNLTAGRGVVLICPTGTRLRRYIHAGPTLRYIGITMSMEQLERGFGIDRSTLRSEVRALACGGLHEPVAIEFHMTAEQRQAVDTLLSPKVDKRLNHIFLDAKLTELACLSVSWLLLDGPNGRMIPCLRDRQSQALEQAAMMMATDVSDQSSIRDICRRVGLNRNKLAAGFHERFGMSPCSYRKKLRLRRAAELVVATNLSVFEVSQEVGFSSQSSFARAFKDEFGETPRSYRAAALTAARR